MNRRLLTPTLFVFFFFVGMAQSRAAVFQSEDVAVRAPSGWVFKDGRNKNTFELISPDRSISVHVWTRRMHEFRVDNLEEWARKVSTLEAEEHEKTAASRRLKLLNKNSSMRQVGNTFVLDFSAHHSDGMQMVSKTVIQVGGVVSLAAESRIKPKAELEIAMNAMTATPKWLPASEEVIALLPALEAKERGDLEEFRRLIDPMMRLGNESAIMVYATHLRERKRYTDAVALLRPLAEKGNAEAQFQLSANLFFGGDEVEADSWLRKAARQGQTDAVRMMRNQAEAPRPVNRNLSVIEFVRYLEVLLPQKILETPADKTACYRKPKETLVALYRAAVRGCAAQLTDKVGEWFPEADGVDNFRWMAQCSNGAVFKEVEISQAELAVCLGP